MDRIAERGRVGRILTVPPGLPPGSDVANLSLMGYDAAANYQGRGPIEAASIGVPLGPDDTAFRCNLVTLGGGLMADYSAGHIKTEESQPMLRELQDALGTDRISFVPGISYRHLSDHPRFSVRLGLHAPARHLGPGMASRISRRGLAGTSSST